jgi:hypothetical protein
MPYRPPFVSERVDEPGHFEDCTYAAGMMTLASWTFGEATSNDHVPMNARQLADLRHELRPGGKGGTNPADVDKAVQKKFPDLPHMPSWDNDAAKLLIDFPTWKKRVQDGECGILQGNPVKVKDNGSPLRKFVVDVKHAIYVESSPDPAMPHVLDPMGLPLDTYDGDRVSWKDLEEFASFFTTFHVFVSLVPKGEQFSANVVRAKLDKTNNTLATQKASITALKGDNDQLVADKAAATVTIAGLKTARDAALAAQKTAEDALGQAKTTLAADQTAIDAFTAQVADLQTKLDAAVTQGTDLQAKLDACASGADLAAATQKVAELTTQNATLTTSLEACAQAMKAQAAVNPPPANPP